MKKIDIYKIMMVRDSSSRYEGTMGSPDEVTRWANMALNMGQLAEEEFWMICLDTKNNVCGVHMVSRGNLNSSIVHPREVFKRALINNAASIIVLHNHPSGNPLPSQNDIDVTRRLKEAGELMGIPLMDHIIIADTQHISMKEKFLL